MANTFTVILRFAQMRVFSLSHFPSRCDQTDVEIELSSQSYVDSTIFKKKCWLVIGFVGILDALGQIVQFLGLKHKKEVLYSFYSVFGMLRFAPAQTNSVRNFGG